MVLENLKKHWPQLMASLAATSGMVSDGCHISWASPAVPILKSPNSPVVITESDIRWLELLYFLGSLAGLPFTIWSLEKFGRKKSIMMGSICSIAAWTLIATAKYPWMLFLARALAGTGGNVVFVSIPMYLCELSHESIRGLCTGMINIIQLLGIILCYSMVPFLPLTTSACIAAIFPVIQFTSMAFMRESPYYYLMKGKNDHAKQSLQFFRRTENVETEFSSLRQAVERQSKERGQFKDIFIVKSNRKAVIIITILNMAQHLSGYVVILMNLHLILTQAAIDADKNTLAIIFSVVMLISCILSSGLVDKLGRKVLLSISTVACAVALCCLAVYFTIKNFEYSTDCVTWMPIAGVFIFALFYRLGVGSIPIIMVGELFPTSVKSKAMTLADATWGTSGTIAMYLYQMLTEYVGYYAAFWLFCISCVIMTAFVMFIVPETKGKTLEEIQFILKGIDIEEYKAEAVNTSAQNAKEKEIKELENV